MIWYKRQGVGCFRGPRGPCAKDIEDILHHIYIYVIHAIGISEWHIRKGVRMPPMGGVFIQAPAIRTNPIACCMLHLTPKRAQDNIIVSRPLRDVSSFYLQSNYFVTTATVGVDDRNNNESMALCFQAHTQLTKFCQRGGAFAVPI
jgi:hypothetical protein